MLNLHLTRHERAKYASATMLGVAGMHEDGFEERKDLRKTEIDRGMKCVEKTMKGICNFINPFEIYEHDGFLCPSSSKQVPQEIAKKMIEPDKNGATEHDHFVEETLCQKKNSIQAPTKRKKIKAFVALKKTVTIKETK